MRLQLGAICTHTSRICIICCATGSTCHTHTGSACHMLVRPFAWVTFNILRRNGSHTCIFQLIDVCVCVCETFSSNVVCAWQVIKFSPLAFAFPISASRSAHFKQIIQSCIWPPTPRTTRQAFHICLPFVIKVVYLVIY